jgi:hypothetical protein
VTRENIEHRGHLNLTHYKKSIIASTGVREEASISYARNNTAGTSAREMVSLRAGKADICSLRAGKADEDINHVSALCGF